MCGFLYNRGHRVLCGVHHKVSGSYAVLEDFMRASSGYERLSRCYRVFAGHLSGYKGLNTRFHEGFAGSR